MTVFSASSGSSSASSRKLPQSYGTVKTADACPAMRRSSNAESKPFPGWNRSGIPPGIRSVIDRYGLLSVAAQAPTYRTESISVVFSEGTRPVEIQYHGVNAELIGPEPNELNQRLIRSKEVPWRTSPTLLDDANAAGCQLEQLVSVQGPGLAVATATYRRVIRSIVIDVAVNERMTDDQLQGFWGASRRRRTATFRAEGVFKPSRALFGPTADDSCSGLTQRVSSRASTPRSRRSARTVSPNQTDLVGHSKLFPGWSRPDIPPGFINAIQRFGGLLPKQTIKPVYRSERIGLNYVQGSPYIEMSYRSHDKDLPRLQSKDLKQYDLESE